MDRSSFPGYRATFAASDDDEIRKYVLAELAKTAWAPRVGITIVVTDGIVELDGAILNEKEREALRVAAENVRGVKGVLDHLVWVEPVSGIVIGAPDDEQGPKPPAVR
jgi:osmotically-inducible protein OsmY